MTEYDQQSGAASLKDSIAALLGETAVSGQAVLQRALLDAFEHLLRQQQWARERLQVHAGQSISCVLDAKIALPSNEFRVRIDQYGFLEPDGQQTPADVTLYLRPSAEALITMIREGPEAVTRHMRIEGNPSLATTLGDLARYLRWEPEEDLSQLIGDVAAHRIAALAKAGFSQFRQMGDSVFGSATTYFAGSQQQVTTQPLIGWLREGRNHLERRVAALEARLARLQAQVKG